MALEGLNGNINELKQFDFQSEVTDILNENGPELVKMLKRQLMSGRDKNKDSVTIFGREFYRDDTIFNKERHGHGIGAITNWITNYMSGSFYSSIYVAAIGSEFIFDSDVSYFGDIIARSGDRIMELDDEHLKYVSEVIVIPELIRRFKDSFNV